MITLEGHACSSGKGAPARKKKNSLRERSSNCSSNRVGHRLLAVRTPIHLTVLFRRQLRERQTDQPRRNWRHAREMVVDVVAELLPRTT
jgi:hypothetical protein